MRRLLCFVFLTIYVCPAIWAQEPTMVVDSLDQPQYPYWQPRYYDSIAVAHNIQAPNNQNFDQMVVRYQNKDFEYVESISQKLNFLDKIFDRLSKFLDGLFPKRSYEYDESIFYLLGIGGGLIFLILLYKLFFSGKKVYVKLGNEERDDEEQIEFVERNLMQIDLRHYIQEALQKENYPLAIRYQQLHNIQLLHEKGWIDWKYSKTNMELIEDVANRELKEDFLKCASIFDYVWFGDFKIGKAEYEKFEHIFRQFQQRWV